MVELYDHQETALNLLRLNDGFALFMEQGTGKTFPVLFRLAELAASGRIRSALVVAPKAVCESWRAKIAMLDAGRRRALDRIRLDICGYDIVWRRREVAEGTYDAVVLDESHYVKSPAAKRTKACVRLCSRAKYRWVLTGTPTSNGQLCNIWSQFACIDPVTVEGRNGQSYVYPGCLGGDSYYKWIQRVAYLDKWNKPWKYRDVAALQDVIAEMSYRITKAECLDLPEKLPDEVLHVGLPSTLKQNYRSMAKHSAIEELDVLAGNPLTRALRLRQMCSGFLEDGGELREYACEKPGVLRGFLADFEGKVVVFCEFRHSIDEVAHLLGQIGMNPVVLDGRSKGDEWRTFQEDPDVRAIVCQYQSGSAGIDLYAADTIVFYEPTLRSDLNEQAKDRIHRVGQHRPCSYYYMLTDGTIEWAIYKALVNYRDFGEALFTQWLGEYVKGESIER